MSDTSLVRTMIVCDVKAFHAWCCGYIVWCRNVEMSIGRNVLHLNGGRAGDEAFDCAVRADSSLVKQFPSDRVTGWFGIDEEKFDYVRAVNTNHADKMECLVIVPVARIVGCFQDAVFEATLAIGPV